jgi:hypothetical protein
LFLVIVIDFFSIFALPLPLRRRAPGPQVILSQAHDTAPTPGAPRHYHQRSSFAFAFDFSRRSVLFAFFFSENVLGTCFIKRS